MAVAGWLARWTAARRAHTAPWAAADRAVLRTLSCAAASVVWAQREERMRWACRVLAGVPLFSRHVTACVLRSSSALNAALWMANEALGALLIHASRGCLTSLPAPEGSST
jgi:hypothetical protein